MSIINPKIQAIINLMDDDSIEVQAAISDFLKANGTSIIPDLEQIWLAGNHTNNTEIENIIRKLQEEDLINQFKTWFQTKEHSLLDMCILVNKIKYPSLNTVELLDNLKTLITDCWVRLFASGHPTEIVNVLNYVFYTEYGFSGDSITYNNPNNSFLSKLFELKKGNPITLSCLYILVAQQLGIPIFGVNLPQHFVVAYCGSSKINPIPGNTILLNKQLDPKNYGEILFYINPFTRGITYTKQNLEDFIQSIGLKHEAKFMNICSNVDILNRMLRNLHHAFQEQNDTIKVAFVEKIKAIIS